VSTAATERWMTPPAIAAEIGKDISVVLGWIHRAELPAFNLAERPGQRPRFKVKVEDWQAFLRRRQVQPPIPRQRRRRRVQDSSLPEYV
jgi:hypothetical protein